MSGRMIVRHGEREWVWGCDDDLTMVAIERVFRDRLTAGETVYFSAAAHADIGRSYATVVIPPSAFVTFSYTDFDGDALTPLAARVVDLVDRDGGLTLDANDEIVDIA